VDVSCENLLLLSGDSIMTHSSSQLEKAKQVFELKLIGLGYVNAVAESDGRFTCLVTLLHGAKEAPSELTLFCLVSNITGQYLKKTPSIIEDNRLIEFEIDDPHWEKSDTDQDESVLVGNMGKVKLADSTRAQISQSESYFDLHLHGCGYANRIREVQPKRAEPFWAVSVGAIYGGCGAENGVGYTSVDCRVSGSVAQDRIQQLYHPEAASEEKIIIGFVASDIYVDQFEGDNGPVHLLKGRLLKINWAKTNGHRVFFGDDS
jgi:Protein of unknown function (DUF3577)